MRKKIKFIPHSLFVAIPIFIMSMIVLIYVFNIGIIPSIIVSIAEWVFAANEHVETHYLQEQIDELKKNLNKQ